MGDPAADMPASRAGWLRPWDDRQAPWTNGLGAGTSAAAAWRRLGRAYAVIAAFLFLVDCINIASTLYDARRMGRPLAVLEPVTWEFTSGIAQVCSCGVIYLALAWATPGRSSWRRVLPTHILASLIFSALHTGLMTLLRIPVYAARGLSYRLPPFGDVIYEYRKDIIAYLVLAALFWLFCRPGSRAGSAADPAETTPAQVAATFDIVEGANIMRAPLRQILAVRAAGNYVEFLLEDGRRPLMRAALSRIEGRLERHGFLRTHRSWIVNPACLNGLLAVGSGDYRLLLGAGAEAPLSRRFPQALERLKQATV